MALVGPSTFVVVPHTYTRGQAYTASPAIDVAAGLPATNNSRLLSQSVVQSVSWLGRQAGRQAVSLMAGPLRLSLQYYANAFMLLIDWRYITRSLTHTHIRAGWKFSHEPTMAERPAVSHGSFPRLP